MTDNLAQGRTAMVFGTPIATYEWPDSEALNNELRALILEKEAASDGIARSNVGGWHSDLDLLKWDHPAAKTFGERIASFAQDLTAVAMAGGEEDSLKLGLAMTAWANVSRDGHYNSVHDHPEAHWSGVYYVSCSGRDPEIPSNAQLELLDPRTGVNMRRLRGSVMEGRMVIDPLPGLMVFFPSWLKHHVHPYRGTGERISISYNIQVQMADTSEQG
ncbi:MAG: TIGR02466 family protein [Pseudomonadota bacterium]